MRTDPPVMLFAAGKGTRMAPLTDDRPKPMVEVAGRPLVDHALDLVRAAGLRRVVANTHYRPKTLEAHLAARNVRISREPALLDTGGGLRKALPLLGPGPVVTLNCDAVWRGGNPIADLLAAWQPGQMEALLALIHPKNAIGHPGAGDFRIDAQGRLSRGPGMIYTGAQILATDRLAAVAAPAFSLNRIWDEMAAKGRLFGVTFKGRWCDVGQPDSVRLAEAMLNV